MAKLSRWIMVLALAGAGLLAPALATGAAGSPGGAQTTAAAGKTAALPAEPAADWGAAVQATITPGTSAIQPAAPDWFYAGEQTGAQLGFVVHTAGDVNGDGYADVIVGSRYYSAPGYTQTGRAYLFHGAADGLPATPTQIIDPPVLNDYGFFGNSVGTAGDVNGDGYDDVIIGMPNYEGGAVAPHDEGAVFVWYGSATGLGASHDWMAESNLQWAHFGISSGTAGDVNGDGYDDIIVGAMLNVVYNTVSHAYVWYGSASGLGDPGTPDNADWIAQAITTQAYTGFGSSVGTAGDVNGDGYADIVVTAPYYDNTYTDEGAVFVWHGSAGGLGDPGTPADADWVVYGGQAEARLGGYDPNGANTAGDVNGDGYDDLIAGAYLYDGSAANEGRVHVWHGSPAGLSATPDWTAHGGQEGAVLGFMVGTAGDINGDGYDDVIVGAHGYDTPISNAGAALIWHGSAVGLGEDGTPANADWMAAGDQADGYHGQAVGAAGDVNGDGLDDVIVGAPMYDNPGAVDGGRAYVYHGSTSCWARLNDNPTDYYTVQAAVDASTDPDDVVKVAGTCQGAWMRDGLTQSLHLSRTLTVQGGYTTTNWTTPDPLAHPTVLDAQGLGRVVYVAGDVSPLITGLHITGGDAAEGDSGGDALGGGLYVITATATISNCWIYGNTAAVGGGVSVEGADVTLAGNEIHSNTADWGGGVAADYSTIGLTRNQIHHNTGNDGGGGLDLYRSVGVLTENAIFGNSANSAGGINLYESNGTLTANTITTNTATYDGGGLYLTDSPSTLTGNTIRGNAADQGSAGGIKIEGEGSDDALLTGNEIAYNTANWVGAGVFVNESSPTLTGNWIHHNTGNEGSGITFSWSEAVISGNTIEHNSSQWRGGGLALRDESRIALLANVIRDNDAQWEGGAVFMENSAPVLINNAILDNGLTEDGDGDGLSIRTSTAVLLHNTLSGNTGGKGYGLFVGAESTATLTNTIIVSHTTGVFVAGGGAAMLAGVLWYGNGADTDGEGTIVVDDAYSGDPLFAADGYHLTEDSAAIDRGLPAGLFVDIDGDERPALEGYDLGADEFVPLPPVFTVFLPLAVR